MIIHIYTCYIIYHLKVNQILLTIRTAIYSGGVNFLLPNNQNQQQTQPYSQRNHIVNLLLVRSKTFVFYEVKIVFAHYLITFFIHSFIHSFIYSFIHPFIHLFMYSFIHLFVYSFIHLFVHSFIHLFQFQFQFGNFYSA